MSFTAVLCSAAAPLKWVILWRWLSFRTLPRYLLLSLYFLLPFCLLLVVHVLTALYHSLALSLRLLTGIFLRSNFYLKVPLCACLLLLSHPTQAVPCNSAEILTQQLKQQPEFGVLNHLPETAVNKQEQSASFASQQAQIPVPKHDNKAHQERIDRAFAALGAERITKDSYKNKPWFEDQAPLFKVETGLVAPELELFAQYFLQPSNYGQAYIGRITLREYAQAWRLYLKDLADNQRCYVFEQDDFFSVFGEDCLKMNRFNRIEARADQAGMLDSILLVQSLGTEIPLAMMQRYLAQRYQPLNPKGTPLEEVVLLSSDLCTVMQLNTHHAYQCTTDWYSNDNSYLIFKSSRYHSRDYVILLFASVEYFNEVYKPMVKRRLALIRKDMRDKGIDDTSVGAMRGRSLLEINDPWGKDD